MAGFSLNKVQLIGRLGKDPEVKSFSNGNKVCNLTVATEENWRDKSSGERKSKTEWHRVAIFQEGLIGIAEQYLQKGAMVYLEGKVVTRSWGEGDAKRYATEIVLQGFGGTLGMLGGKSDGGSRGAPDDGDDGFGEPDAASNRNAKPQQRRPANDMDDDIPF